MACSVWIVASLQQPRIYEWADSPPEAERWQRSRGDVTLEMERREGSGMSPPIHSSLTLSHSLCCAHPTYPVMGSCYRRVTYNPQHSATIFPSPAQAGHAWSSATDSGPSHRNPNFMPTLQRPQRAVLIQFARICVFICAAALAHPLANAYTARQSYPLGKYRHTQQPVHYSELV